MKSKTTAFRWAILLGCVGAHKFYLGKTTMGVLYVLACWTFIPVLISIIEAIQLFRMSDEKFNETYNDGVEVKQEKFITQETKQKTFKGLKRFFIGSIGFVVLMLVLGVFGVFDYTEEELAQMEIERVEQQKIDQELAEQQAIDNQVLEEELRADNLERLRNEVVGIDSYDTSTIQGDAVSLATHLGTINYYKRLVSENISSEDEETKELAEQLKTKISGLQSRVYPIMRKKYSENADTVLWENNIDVSVKGSYSDTIVFVGGMFANNGNIKEMHESVEDMLVELRFTDAEYRWIPGGEGAIFSFESLPDSEVVYE